MKVSIIGSGNIAWFMALRLKDAGCDLLEIYGRNPNAAKALAEKTFAKSVVSLNQLDNQADAYIFAIPDNVLKGLSEKFPFPDKVQIHCAGAMSIDTLKSEETGILWPLYSINKENLPQTNNIPLFWEAKGARSVSLVPELASLLSSNTHQAGLQQRQELHLSAVFVNNFVNHLMAITQTRMEEVGLPFVESLQPIIERTLTAALAEQAVVSQTGPAIRNDGATMQKHLQLLAAHPEWQVIYKAISTSIHQFYNSLK